MWTPVLFQHHHGIQMLVGQALPFLMSHVPTHVIWASQISFFTNLYRHNCQGCDIMCLFFALVRPLPDFNVTDYKLCVAQVANGQPGFLAYETRFWFPSKESRSYSPFYYSYEVRCLCLILRQGTPLPSSFGTYCAAGASFTGMGLPSV